MKTCFRLIIENTFDTVEEKEKKEKYIFLHLLPDGHSPLQRTISLKGFTELF